MSDSKEERIQKSALNTEFGNNGGISGIRSGTQGERPFKFRRQEGILMK
ncbi:MAG: hypothetical protein MR218_08910 [Eubacterium sp.]|nr:hypothetical protein [Eubacterium sp.]